ncbi:MAG: serine/threonine protein kinase [bacterium]|nr:serine/threonine protein kinase [bacterium]
MASAINLDELAGVPVDFGGYRILELIERVAGVHVFLARQASIDRLVTLTVLPESQGEKSAFKQRFERQVLAASRVNHPNVVRAVDAGSVEGHRYIASEYAGGTRLSELLARGEWVSIRRCVAIASDIATALAHLETTRLVHRSVTPRAIVLAEAGVAKLRGFSLSKFQEGDASQTWFDFDAYDAQYMSPEIVRSARFVDARADIYSFGCVLYHVLTGQTPFPGERAVDIMKMQVETAPRDPRELRDDLPEALCEVLLKCLRKDVAMRHRSAAELAEKVNAIRKGERSARRVPAPQQRPHWFSRLFRSPE